MDQTFKTLFWAIAQEPLGVLKFQCYFFSSLDNLLQDDIFLKKVFIIVRYKAQNMVIFC